METGLGRLNVPRTLLVAERLRSGGYRNTRLYPATVAILNLFLCASFEPHLKEGGTYYLSVFLFLEVTLHVVLSSLNFSTFVSEILAKSRIFPTRSAQRMLFVITSSLRRPLLLALAASNVLFLLILFHSTVWAALAVAPLFVFLIFVTETLLSTFLLIATRYAIPFGGMIVLLGFLVVVVVIGAFAFRVESLVEYIPILQWATHGIIAAEAGNIGGAAGGALRLFLTEISILFVGRRFA